MDLTTSRDIFYNNVLCIKPHIFMQIKIVDCIVLGLRSKCQEPINIPFSCVSDNAIEAVDEFAFLEGEFTVSTGDVSSNLTETDACFSSVHGNSSPCFLFLGKKKKRNIFHSWELENSGELLA